MYPPHLLLNDEAPASNSRRFVAGDVQVACVIFSRSGHMFPDSGDVVEVPRAIQSSPRSRQPSPVFTSVEPVQFAWYSQKKPALFLGVTWPVRRMASIFLAPADRA